jgi:hypothetical protein
VASLQHTLRPIRSIDVLELNGWHVKLYGVRLGAELPDANMLVIARELALATLPQPAASATRYACAFVTVHQAEPFNQIVIDWWEHTNELRHRVYKASPSAPLQFQDITHTGEAFCIWELRVICHEREAWLRHVLQGPQDFEGYLADVLNCEA